MGLYSDWGRNNKAVGPEIKAPLRRCQNPCPPRTLPFVRLAVPTPDQVDENIVGQVLDRMLDRVQCNGIGFTGISNGEVCRDGEAPRWRASIGPPGPIPPCRSRQA